ncbi:MAG: DUF58 domain-containing protein [Actinobacteria bacterium]|nr:DUF58 domain-containing protein [Actinomycetota bacterium]
MAAATREESATRVAVRMRPSGVWLLVLSGLALLFWLGSRAEAQLALAMASFTAVLLDSRVAQRSLARLSLSLHGPTDALAGEPVAWVLTAHGIRRPVTVTAAMRPQPRRVLVADEQPVLVGLPATSRGMVHRLLLDVTATGPLGLFEAGRRYRVTPVAPVFVGPPAIPDEPDWPPLRAVGFGFTETAPVGDELFRSIRPYIRGDERRRIHWASTARHGQLMVRESDGVGMVALQVVVDLGPAGPAAEWVASAAAGVAEAALRRGWLVQLVTLDGGSVEPPLTPLGSPFGAPPLPPAPQPVPLQTASTRVRTPAMVRRQLATAAHGAPVPPPFPGLVCHVDGRGVTWR